MHSQSHLFRIAAISVLAMALIAGYAYGFAFQAIYIPNDPGKTFSTLNNTSFLFRSFLFSFLLVLILDVIVAWSLHLLLRTSNEALSLLCAWLRLVYATLLGAALAPLCGLLNAAQTLSPERVMSSFQSFQQTWSAGLIIFGLHLLLLGYLLIRSGMVPKWLGMLTLFAALCYMVTNTLNLLFPGYAAYRETVDSILALPMALGELGIAVCFFFKARTQVVAV